MPKQSRVAVLGAFLLAAGLMTSGCSAEQPPQSGQTEQPKSSTAEETMPKNSNELYEAAKGHYVDYRVAVAKVQEHLAPGEWESAKYGDGPGACDDLQQYGFDLRRDVGNGNGWRLKSSPEDSASDLASWFESNEWKNVETKSLGNGAMSVAASLPGVIDRIVVQFLTGEAADGISLRATTECFPGDQDALYDKLSGETTDWLSAKLYQPTSEAFDAVPAFGVTTENKPNFLETEWNAAWGEAAQA